MSKLNVTCIIPMSDGEQFLNKLGVTRTAANEFVTVTRSLNPNGDKGILDIIRQFDYFHKFRDKFGDILAAYQRTVRYVTQYAYNHNGELPAHSDTVVELSEKEQADSESRYQQLYDLDRQFHSDLMYGSISLNEQKELVQEWAKNFETVINYLATNYQGLYKFLTQSQYEALDKVYESILKRSKIEKTVDSQHPIAFRDLIKAINNPSIKFTFEDLVDIVNNFMYYTYDQYRNTLQNADENTERTTQLVEWSKKYGLLLSQYAKPIIRNKLGIGLPTFSYVLKAQNIVTYNPEFTNDDGEGERDDTGEMDLNEVSMVSREHWTDMVTVNLRKRLNARLKMLFERFVVDENPTTRFGTVNYHDGKEVYYQLADALYDCEDSDDLIERLSSENFNAPFKGQLLETLSKHPELATNLFHSLKLSQNKFIVVNRSDNGFVCKQSNAESVYDKTNRILMSLKARKHSHILSYRKDNAGRFVATLKNKQESTKYVMFYSAMLKQIYKMSFEEAENSDSRFYYKPKTKDGYVLYDPETKSPVRPKRLYRYEDEVTIGQLAEKMPPGTLLPSVAAILETENYDFHKLYKDLTISQFMNVFLRELGCDLIAVDPNDMHNRILHSWTTDRKSGNKRMTLWSFKHFMQLFAGGKNDLFSALSKESFDFKQLLVREIYKKINHQIETDHTYSHYFDGKTYQTYSPINFINNKTQEMHNMDSTAKMEALEALKKDWYSGYFVENNCPWFNSWELDYYTGESNDHLNLGYFLRSGQMDWRKTTHRAYLTAAMSAFFKSPQKNGDRLYLAPTLESKGTAYYMSNVEFDTKSRVDEYGRRVNDVSDRLVSVFMQELHRIKIVFDQALAKQTETFSKLRQLVNDYDLTDNQVIELLNNREKFIEQYSAVLASKYDDIVTEYKQKSLSPTLKQIVGGFNEQDTDVEKREDDNIRYIIDFDKPLNGATFHLLNEFRSVWESAKNKNIKLTEDEQNIMNYIYCYLYSSQQFPDLKYTYPQQAGSNEIIEGEDFDLVADYCFEACKNLRSLVSAWINDMLEQKTKSFADTFETMSLIELTLPNDIVKTYRTYLSDLKDPNNANQAQTDKMQAKDRRVKEIEAEAQQNVYRWMFNHYYANSQMLTMLAGDTALYGDVDTLTKRLPELSTGGSMVDQTAKHDTINDVTILHNKNIMVFEDLDNIIAHPQLAKYLEKQALAEANALINKLDVSDEQKDVMRRNAEAKAKKLGKDYEKINGTDGQSIMSIAYLRSYLFQMGELTEEENAILKCIENIYTVPDENLSELLAEYDALLANLGEPLDLNTKKTFSYTLLPRAERDGEGHLIQSKKPIPIKTADMFDLDPRTFIYFDEQGHPHKDNNNLMYRLQNFMLVNNIHGLCADSALKVYQPGKTSIDTRIEGRTVDSIIADLTARSRNQDYVITFPTIYNLHTMATKSDFADLERVVGIQFQKLMGESLNEDQTFEFDVAGEHKVLNGIDMFNLIDHLYGKMYQLAAAHLREKFTDLDKHKELTAEQRYRERNRIISQMLLQQLENSDSFSANTFSALLTDENGNFNVPLATSSLYTQVQKLIISLVKNNIIGVDLPGGDFIQVANIVNVKDTMRRIQQISLSEADTQINSVLQIKLADLDLSVRTVKFLQSLRLETVRDLVTQSKNNLDRLSKFNKPIMTELSELVNRFNLEFGMDVKKFDTYNNEIDQITSPDLNMEFEYAADGKTITGIKWMEVAIPFYLKDQMEDYLDENGMFKMDEIPDEMKEIIGYRIPTEGLCSIFPMKVKYFTNPSAGGNIKVPAIMTKISGSDFDIDKVYFVRNAFDKNGQYITPSVDSIEGIGNYLFLLYKNILLNPSMENERMKPQGFETIEKMSAFVGFMDNVKHSDMDENTKKQMVKDAADDNYNASFEKLIDTRSPCDPLVQSDLHSRNQIAAQAIGIAAVHRQVHAFLRHYSVPVLSDIPIMMENTNITQHGPNNVKVIQFDAEYCRDGVTKISDVLREILGASVDAAKKPLFGQLNFTLYTFDIVCTLARMGFTIEDIALIMQQPIVRTIIDNCEAAAEKSETGYVNTTEVINGLINKYLKGIVSTSAFNFTHDQLIDGILTQSANAPQQLDLLGFFKYISEVADDCFELNTLCRADSLTGNTWQSMYEYISMISNRAIFMHRLNNGQSWFTNKVLEVFIGPEEQPGQITILGAPHTHSDKLVQCFAEADKFLNDFMAWADIPQLPENWQAMLLRLAMEIGMTRISGKQVRNYISAYHSYIYNRKRIEEEGDNYNLRYYLGTKDGNIEGTFLNRFLQAAAMFEQDYPTIFSANDSLVLTKPSFLREKNSVKNFQILNLYYRERTPEFNNDFMTEWEKMRYDEQRFIDAGYSLSQFAKELQDYVIIKNGFNINNNSFAKYIPYNTTSHQIPEHLRDKALLSVAKDNIEYDELDDFNELFIRHNKFLIPRMDFPEVNSDPTKEVQIDGVSTGINYFINQHGVLYKRIKQDSNRFISISFLGAREIGLEYFPQNVSKNSAFKNATSASYFNWLNAWWAQDTKKNTDGENTNDEQAKKEYRENITKVFQHMMDFLLNEKTKKSAADNLQQALREMGILDIYTVELNEQLSLDDLKKTLTELRKIERQYCK